MERDGSAVTQMSLTSLDPNADFKYKQSKSLSKKIFAEREPLLAKQERRYNFTFSTYE